MSFIKGLMEKEYEHREDLIATAVDHIYGRMKNNENIDIEGALQEFLDENGTKLSKSEFNELADDVRDRLASRRIELHRGS